tara:strand:+ start:41 stop:403 length:363 start_codon:yes stop_codon:yes gene_type:complete
MSKTTIFFLSIPITFALVFLTNKTSEYMVNDLQYNDKIQRAFVINFVIGLILGLLSFILFSKDKIFSNYSLKLATLFTSFIFIVLSVITEWNNLIDTTKIIIVCMYLFVLLSFSYQYSSF